MTYTNEIWSNIWDFIQSHCRKSSRVGYRLYPRADLVISVRMKDIPRLKHSSHGTLVRAATPELRSTPFDGMKFSEAFAQRGQTEGATHYVAVNTRFSGGINSLN